MEQRTFDELISDFNSTVSKWEIELKYKFKLLGMIASIGYEHEKMLNNLPSAQSEIIKCEDCMHNGSFDTDCPIGWNGKEYCSFAERKIDE